MLIRMSIRLRSFDIVALLFILLQYWQITTSLSTSGQCPKYNDEDSRPDNGTSIMHLLFVLIIVSELASYINPRAQNSITELSSRIPDGVAA